MNEFIDADIIESFFHVLKSRIGEETEHVNELERLDSVERSVCGGREGIGKQNRANLAVNK